MAVPTAQKTKMLDVLIVTVGIVLFFVLVDGVTTIDTGDDE